MALMLLAFGMLALANLQDIARCDPSDKDSNCPPDPGFAASTSFDFTTPPQGSSFEDLWSSNFDADIDPNTGNGIAFRVSESGGDVTLTSNKYLFFGKVTVELQAAPGQGIISSIVLKSDSGDEIDWEILGAYDNQAQTNYFYDGDALFNTYNTTYYLNSSVIDEFHNYTIEWTDKWLVFSIDDILRKTWRIGDIPPQNWPQTPMQVRLRLWSVAEDDDAGEIAWAGGLPEWDSEPPPQAYFKRVEIEDYAGWCQEVEGDVEYSYDERMGGWQDVRIMGCAKKLSPGMYTPDVPTRGSTMPATTWESGYSEPTDTVLTSTLTEDETTSSMATERTSTIEMSGGTTSGESSPQETDAEDAAAHVELSSVFALISFLIWIILV